MSKQGTFAKLARSRQSLLEAIEGLSHEEMSQLPLVGRWTAKDIIGHLTSWEETLLAPLQAYAGGEPFATERVKDYLAWNDEQAALKQSTPLEEIMEQAASVREGLVASAGKLSDEQWTASVPYPWGGNGSVKRALLGLAGHEMEHVEAIRTGRTGG